MNPEVTKTTTRKDPVGETAAIRMETENNKEKENVEIQAGTYGFNDIEILYVDMKENAFGCPLPRYKKAGTVRITECHKGTRKLYDFELVEKFLKLDADAVWKATIEPQTRPELQEFGYSGEVYSRPPYMRERCHDMTEQVVRVAVKESGYLIIEIVGVSYMNMYTKRGRKEHILMRYEAHPFVQSDSHDVLQETDAMMITDVIPGNTMNSGDNSEGTNLEQAAEMAEN